MRDTTGISSPGRNTPATISFMEVSIPRWISSAADGTLNMTVGSLLPVAPPNHLAAVHVTSAGRSTTQAKRLPTAATGAGRFMLTYREHRRVGKPIGQRQPGHRRPARRRKVK